MRHPRVDMEGIATVVALAETGDTLKAAALLSVGPSAVLKRLAKAEHTLSTTLIRKTPQGMVVTPNGKAYCSEATLALEHAVLAEDKVAASLKLSEKRLLVGHSTYLPQRLLTLVAQCNAEELNGIAVEHESGLSREIEEKVANGLLHVGVTFMPVRHPALKAELLLEEQLVAYMRKSHPLAVKPMIRPEDLDGVPIIAVARKPFPDLHEEIAEFYRGFGIELRIVAEAFGPGEALILVEQGFGISFLSRSVATQNPNIAAKSLSTRILTRKYGVFYRQDNHHPALRRFTKSLSGKLNQVKK
jgi:DNA-binding transcriptional LysR family regulator